VETGHPNAVLNCFTAPRFSRDEGLAAMHGDPAPYSVRIPHGARQAQEIMTKTVFDASMSSLEKLVRRQMIERYAALSGMRVGSAFLDSTKTLPH
jgi:hypothetical protein